MRFCILLKGRGLALMVFLFFWSFGARAITADFTVSVTAGCDPLLVSFKDVSTGGPATKWLWDFGNGNTANIQNPGAIYKAAGTYTIKLTVEDASGNKDTKTKTGLITVYGKPTVDFKSDKFGGCSPLTVGFTNLSTQGSATISTWVWDFGDGSTSSKQNPGTHTYTANGRFDVTLFAKDANGCQNTITKKSFIVVPPKPSIDFTADNTGACAAPLKVNFSPSVAVFPGGSVTYLWDFGDGANSTLGGPSHSYSANGSYTVSLTVTDSAGCSNTVTKNAYIKIGKPKADFQLPGSGCSPYTAKFVNTTNPLPGGSTFSWDFGDGKTSTAQDPTHTYANSGTYYVKLIVTSPGGCVDSIRKGPISVKTGPVVSFDVSDTVGCSVPLSISFKNTSPNSTTVAWDFGDSTTSTLNNPTHTYTRVDTFDVRLTVSYNGCSNSITKKSVVKIAKPVASFTITPVQGCAPVTVTIKEKSTAPLPITSWQWDFGDNTTSSKKDPSPHVYDKAGSYMINLTVKTSNGCQSTYQRQVKVGSKPEADFTANPVTGCMPLKVKFKNLTNTHPTKADSFIWDFGDGANSFEMDPVHTYEVKPGKYDVTLIVKNNGCSDTLIKKQLITLYGPLAHFDLKQGTCTSDSISLTNQAQYYNTIKYDFGDGTTTTDKNPWHKYTTDGGYKVMQIAHNDTTGCTDTFTWNIAVSPLRVDFTTKDTLSCYPSQVKFKSSVNRPLADYLWDFGDGTTDTLSDPTHIYMSKDTFDVKLTVTDIDKCTKTVLKKKYVVTRGPLPSFTISPDRGCIPLTVKIKNQSSSDYPVVSRSYDMGNGVKIKDQDSFEYTYTSPPAVQNGGYIVTLTVTDNVGCASSFARTIYPSKPKLDYTTAFAPSCDKLVYQFMPIANGLSPFKYKWDFGDGNTSTDQVPTHSFAKDGDYTVTITATDANGCIDSVSKVLAVRIKFPEAKFTAQPHDTTCPPLLVNFKDASVPGYMGFRSWFWDFGDGTTSSLQNPQHLYSLPGKYNITLTATDSLGCDATVVGQAGVIVNGPTGSYIITAKRGCRPLTVTFSATSKDATGFKWDLGNGIIADGNPVTYTYDSAGSFIPALILIREALDDTCVYSLPNKDTIVVYPQPTPAFSSYGQCFGYPTFFTDTSTSTRGAVTGWEWDFADGTTSTDQNPVHVYKGPGLYNVGLTVTTSLGCKKTGHKTIKIGGLESKFDISSSTGCAGEPLQFTDRTFADTTVVAWYWDFGDGDTSMKQNPVHTYFKKGFYNVQLVSTDYKGCVDTFIHTGFLIGDTVPPPSPKIYRVTVENDNTIRLDFERYKDIDYHEYIIYRQGPGSAGFVAIDTIRNINDTTYYDTKLDTRNNVYCYRVRAKNVCNFYSPLVSPEHCSIELDATPGINQARLDWNAYKGWDNGVEKYEVYREYVYNPGQYLYLGTVDGNTLMFIDSNIICYRTHHYKIKAYQLGGTGQVSWSDTAATTPIYVPHVPNNEIIRATVENNAYVHIEWTDVPPKIKHKYFILQRSLDGKSYKTIDTAFVRTQLSFDDKKVKVGESFYYYRMFVVDSCGDISTFPSNIGKTILLKADTTVDLLPRLTWTHYKGWKEGVRFYDIELRQLDGSWKNLAKSMVVGGNDTTFIDNITDLNSLPEYCYRVTAHRSGPPGDPDRNLNITSMSNESCVPARSILYVPNAFSPNRDSINDVFKAEGMYIMEFEMTIYDRWGTQVFHSTDMDKGWDGTFREAKPLMDSYRWFIKAKGSDWQYHFLNGWVTILR